MATTTGHKNSLLYLTDSCSGRRFLVDTGAECSVLPITSDEIRFAQRGQDLVAANGSVIKSYGQRTISLHFGTRQFQWTFIVAAVNRPLLGADFLRANSLLVDVAGQQLVDAQSFTSIPLHRANASGLHLQAISASDNLYAKLLSEFPEITTPQFFYGKYQAWRGTFHSNESTASSRSCSTFSTTEIGTGKGRICPYGENGNCKTIK